MDVPELPVFTTPAAQTTNVVKPVKAEKRTWDNFRIKRDCFRLFSTYYKNKFKTFNKRWQSEKRNKRKKSDMKTLIQAYCRVEFGEHSDETFDALMPALIIILHSHRY